MTSVSTSVIQRKTPAAEPIRVFGTFFFNTPGCRTTARAANGLDRRGSRDQKASSRQRQGYLERNATVSHLLPLPFLSGTRGGRSAAARPAGELRCGRHAVHRGDCADCIRTEEAARNQPAGGQAPLRVPQGFERFQVPDRGGVARFRAGRAPEGTFRPGRYV